MRWFLTVFNRDNDTKKEYRFELPSIRLGRDPENDVAIDNDYVSSFHATLIAGPDQISVKDSKSKNGTFVQQGKEWVRVTGDSTFTVPRSIRIGNSVIVFIMKADYPWDPGPDKLPGLSDSREIVDLQATGRSCKEAIMVLDLCGSSQMAHTDDAMALHMKKRLEAITDQVLGRYKMNFRKGTGDGFLATFEDSFEALGAAREILDRLQKRNSASTNPPIEVRIALHCGRTFIIDQQSKDRHGNDVNIAFRLEGLTAPDFLTPPPGLRATNRILVSGKFFSTVAKQPDDILCKFRFLGMAKLKGIEKPFGIFIADN